MVLEHHSELVKANIIAILGTIITVPIPLLIPLLVDEVLLEKPGPVSRSSTACFPSPGIHRCSTSGSFWW